jgi:hypothetical protein
VTKAVNVYGKLVAIGLGPDEVLPSQFLVEDPDCFRVQCFLRLGVSGSQRTADHTLILCSGAWLAQHQPTGSVLRGQPLVLMKHFDGALFQNAMQRFVERCSASTAEGVFERLRCLGISEFDSFDTGIAPQHFMDERHESELL